MNAFISRSYLHFYLAGLKWRSGGTSVWLDDDPTSDGNDSDFQQNDGNCGQPRRLHPSPGGKGRALPPLRPPADIIGEAGRWRGLPLLRLSYHGKAAGKGAVAPRGPRPPDVYPDEG
jgi:hypothetical protein